MLFKYYFCYNSLLLLAKATIIIFSFYWFEYLDCQGVFFLLFVFLSFSAFAIFYDHFFNYYFFLIRVIIAIVFLYSIYFGSESIFCLM